MELFYLNKENAIKVIITSSTTYKGFAYVFFFKFSPEIKKYRDMTWEWEYTYGRSEFPIFSALEVKLL